MGLETGTFVDDLITSNPAGGTDNISEGDDHLRLIKSVLKATFPNADRAFYFDRYSGKTGAYAVVAADDRTFFGGNATSGSFTFTLPLLSAVADGFTVTFAKIDNTANTVTLDGNGSETINGATTFVLNKEYESVSLVSTGSEWLTIGGSLAAQNADDVAITGGTIDDVDISGVVAPNGAADSFSTMILSASRASNAYATLDATGALSPGLWFMTFSAGNEGAGGHLKLERSDALASIEVTQTYNTYNGVIARSGFMEISTGQSVTLQHRRSAGAGVSNLSSITAFGFKIRDL